jgi:2-C-methyl-D-erythritol 4-phosphate cytidylyltransferase
VVAGGSGSRFGGHKQFADLAGVSVAARSVAACRCVADVVVLVAPEGKAVDHHGADTVVVGGRTRSESVRAGLAVLADDVDVVIVHDAARPLASERLFYAVVAELANPDVAGATVATPVVDTIKQVVEVDGRRRVVGTLDRSSLVAVQTPQGFRREVLVAAHADGAEATDDAALVEALGATVVVVDGDLDNLKLTSPSDLLDAERIVELRS